MTVKKRVLILCTGNSARSQMAEAVLREIGKGAFETYSAGTEPRGVNPLTVRALSNAGIDISGARSKPVSDFFGQPFDYVITVCDNANENCPVFPGKTERIHWGFDDPAAVEGTWNERLSAFRRVRDEIAARLREWDEEVDSRQ